MMEVTAAMAWGPGQSCASHWRRASAMASNGSGLALRTLRILDVGPMIGDPEVGPTTLGLRKLGSPTKILGVAGGVAPDAAESSPLHQPVHPVRLVSAASLFDGH